MNRRIVIDTSAADTLKQTGYGFLGGMKELPSTAFGGRLARSVFSNDFQSVLI